MGHLALLAGIWLEVSIIVGMSLGTLIRARNNGEI